MSGIGVAGTKGVDWIEWLIQIALAAFGVAALDRARTAAEHRLTTGSSCAGG
ncbi:hypothetical protein [Streptomyces sp. MA5143a]|uniref:hypothetical protein n=1 Tax=Streptomyces sp. MA5143a TaxID=2083010 RepID=UPI0015E65818|nr:hypothetical protein [Streptomyces sp. MA5143a]